MQLCSEIGEKRWNLKVIPFASYGKGMMAGDKRLSWENAAKENKEKKRTFNIQMNSVKLFDNINLF